MCVVWSPTLLQRWQPRYMTLQVWKRRQEFSDVHVTEREPSQRHNGISSVRTSSPRPAFGRSFAAPYPIPQVTERPPYPRNRGARPPAVPAWGLNCNTLGVWLPLIVFHFINMCIIYLIMPLLLKHAYATFSTVCVSYLIVVNSNGVTCECNMNFSYLETWQHGSNMTSIE